jgi:hypothetical protein
LRFVHKGMKIHELELLRVVLNAGTGGYYTEKGRFVPNLRSLGSIRRSGKILIGRDILNE